MHYAVNFVFLIAIAASTSGCRKADPPPDTAALAQEVDVLTLSSTLVEALEWEEPIVATGTLFAEKTTELAPSVDGIIDQIHVQAGDRVEANQPLFQTRRANYQIRFEESKHRLRFARATATKANRDLERTQQLFLRGAVSDERLDDARTNQEIADAAVGQAEANHARARLELDDTIVRAPYPGVITWRYINEGTMMKVMMPGDGPVLQIMKTDIVVAIVHIPELELPRVQLGTPARIRVTGLQQEFESEVHVLNPRLDVNTRAVELRLGLPNPNFVLNPGLFVEVTLLPEPRSLLALKRGGVLGSGDDRYVFVLDGSRAHRQSVRVRELDATRVEVLGGLEAGDAVLIGPNLPRVSEGSPIQSARANR